MFVVEQIIKQIYNDVGLLFFKNIYIFCVACKYFDLDYYFQVVNI